VGVEVHVKDTGRFAGGWGFYSFEGTGPAKLIPQSATCYSCHAMHGAVDTTFVQYYPTLLPIARRKGTLSASYRQETAPTRAR
jgi:Cytochrome P460